MTTYVIWLSLYTALFSVFFPEDPVEAYSLTLRAEDDPMLLRLTLDRFVTCLVLLAMFFSPGISGLIGWPS